ncbi:hypothetical protein GALMADRAFT_746842 [Galerina marginata CBS 339.88]|uniref:FHA domain-containing protein n=1 Tax=Galerina marginata (strain CBS 339.88) TaxID=685588 RepID=A0A067T218_GALM3|nr:hypothetical protein GALMADRAFT_746842 [Galerina marginata CBS 339.88]
MDDEIVFLGSSSGPGQEISMKMKMRTASPPQGQRPVTGVALHVEEQGGMVFRRASTSVVQIGRRSGVEDGEGHEQEKGSAMFRCAVVSRRHAKIAFSDSGHAYLIDLGSHHGTHIRKPADKFPRTIKPETPTLLADGDVVTFGKSVGKGDDCVRPVVARIELLHGGQPFKPLVVPKSASGRYGVNRSPSLSSDDSFSSHSGIYSDIEEIPPPASSVTKSVASVSVSGSTSSLGQAFDALKRLLPPTHRPSTPRRLPSVTEIVERPLAQMSSFFFGPESVPTSPPDYDSLTLPALGRQAHDDFDSMDFLHPVGFDASEHDIYERDSVDADADADADADEDAVGDEDDGDGESMNSDDNDNDSDSNSNKSRSHSPMDLASPSPAPEVVVSRPLSIPPPPPAAFIISPTPSRHGSVPVSPQPSPPPALSASRSQSQAQAQAQSISHSTSQQSDMDNIPLVNSPDASPVNSRAYSPLTDFLREAAGWDGARARTSVSASASGVGVGMSPWRRVPMVDAGSVAKADVDAKAKAKADAGAGGAELVVDMPTPVVAAPAPAAAAVVTFDDLKPIQATLESLKADISKLNLHRRKYKSRFNTNTSILTSRLSELDDRVLSAQAEIALVSNQVDGERGLRGEVEELAERMGEERRKMREGVDDAVREIKSITLDTNRQIEAEILKMRPVRDAMMQRIRFWEEDDGVVPAVTSPGLKRKRDDIDEDAVGEGKTELLALDVRAFLADAGIEAGLAMDVDVDKDRVSVTAPLPVAPPVESEAELETDAPPPRKRARTTTTGKRIASVVARTATAVTIGAVVTWGALAFS